MTTSHHHHNNNYRIITMPIRISLTVDTPEAASVITAAAGTLTGVADYESHDLPSEDCPADRPAQADDAIGSNKTILNFTINDFLSKCIALKVSGGAQLNVNVPNFASLGLSHFLAIFGEPSVFKSIRFLGKDDRALLDGLKVGGLVEKLREFTDQLAFEAFEEFAQTTTVLSFLDYEHDTKKEGSPTRVNDVGCKMPDRHGPPRTSLPDVPAGRDYYSDCETIEDFTIFEFVYHLNKLVQDFGRDRFGNAVEGGRAIFDRLAPFSELSFGQGRTFGDLDFVDYLRYAGAASLHPSLDQLQPSDSRLLFGLKVCNLYEQLRVSSWADLDAFGQHTVLDFLRLHNAHDSDPLDGRSGDGTAAANKLVGCDSKPCPTMKPDTRDSGGMLSRQGHEWDAKRGSPSGTFAGPQKGPNQAYVDDSDDDDSIDFGGVTIWASPSSGEASIGHRRNALRPVCDPESPFQPLLAEEEANALAARQGAADLALENEWISNLARVASSEADEGDEGGEDSREENDKPKVASWNELAVLAGLLPPDWTLKTEAVTDEDGDEAASLQETASDGDRQWIESLMRVAGVDEDEDVDFIVHPWDQMTAPCRTLPADWASEEDSSTDDLHCFDSACVGTADLEDCFLPPRAKLFLRHMESDREWLADQLRKARLRCDDCSDCSDWVSFCSEDSILFQNLEQAIADADASDRERPASPVCMASLGDKAEGNDDAGEHDSRAMAACVEQDEQLRDMIALKHRMFELTEEELAACLELEGCDDADGLADSRAQAAWDRLQGVSLELRAATGDERRLCAHLRVADAERGWLREVAARLHASQRRKCELQRQLAAADAAIAALHGTATNLRGSSSSSVTAAIDVVDDDDGALQLELDGLHAELAAARTEVLALQRQTARAEGTWTGLLEQLDERDRELDEAKADIDGLRRALENLRLAHVQLVAARQAAEREAAEL